MARPGVISGAAVRPALRHPLDLLAAVAAVAAAASLGISRGFFGVWAIGLMTLAWLAACAAAVLGRFGSTDVSNARATRLLLAIVLVASSCAHFFLPPGMYLVPPQPPVFRVLAAAAALGAATYLVPLPAGLARWRFGFIATCFVAMACVVLIASPQPYIDVWMFQQVAARAILHGDNPYAITYPNIYGGAGLYDPGMIEGGRLTVFPYPPLTFLLGAPALLVLRDVRFMLLAAMVVAAWALRRLGRGDVPELAALVLLLQPTSFFVLEQSWTEPTVLAALGLSVIAIRSLSERANGWKRIGIAGGLLAASKQFSPILAVPLAFALPRRERWRSLALAGGVAVATLLPFILWDPSEFWRDVVAMQFHQPFRPDSLSWLAPIAVALQRPVAPWGFGVALVILLVTLRPNTSLAQALRASSAAFLAFLLFNKQAFCNYYWLAVGLLLFASVLEIDPIAREGASGFILPRSVG